MLIIIMLFLTVLAKCYYHNNNKWLAIVDVAARRLECAYAAVY